MSQQGYKSNKSKKNKKRAYQPVKAPDNEALGRNIQWFPGHMAKTKRKIAESIKLVDVVVEIVDARIPFSSRNPDLDELVARKPRIILLNKMDMANGETTDKWIAHFKSRGISALAVDCKKGKNLNKVLPLVREVLSDEVARWNERGMVGRTPRIMVVGIPNSGKSSFINKMAKRDKAVVEDRPGVTRDNQWYVMADGTQMLDTPGVLWPKFDNQKIAKHLAFTGAIKDNILDVEELACALLVILKDNYCEMIKARYELSDAEFDQAADISSSEILIKPDMMVAYRILQVIGKKRGMLVAGGEVDDRRVSVMLLDEFRGGLIGRISLEVPREK